MLLLSWENQIGPRVPTEGLPHRPNKSPLVPSQRYTTWLTSLVATRFPSGAIAPSRTKLGCLRAGPIAGRQSGRFCGISTVHRQASSAIFEIKASDATSWQVQGDLLLCRVSRELRSQPCERSNRHRRKALLHSAARRAAIALLHCTCLVQAMRTQDCIGLAS